MKVRNPAGDLKASLSDILLSDDWRREVLETLCEAAPYAWITGGFVRNAIWDAVFAENDFCALSDVDVVYLDRGSPLAERSLRAALTRNAPGIPWSVKDQGRMHLRSSDSPYASLNEALSAFPDRSSAIAVRLLPNEKLEALAPFGLEDAFRGLVRPTPRGLADDRYRSFLDRKLVGWRNRWPRLLVASPAQKPGFSRKAA